MMTRADPVVAEDPDVRLYRSSYEPLVRLAWMLLGSRELAEDAVQDCFARFLSRRGPSPEHPAAYLRTMVVNACRDEIRRRRRPYRAVPDPLPPDVSDQTALWEALAALTPRRRTAVVLRYYLDMSLADVAATMRCRVGTASSLLHRAMGDLRKVLDHEPDD